MRASRALGIFVVVFSFGLGGAELLNLNIDRFALPLGCVLFVYLIALRIWSLRDSEVPSDANSRTVTETKAI